jgi:hypothetical protein
MESEAPQLASTPEGAGCLPKVGLSRGNGTLSPPEGVGLPQSLGAQPRLTTAQPRASLGAG